MRTRTWIGVLWMVMMGVLPGEAATIGGLVTDTSGAAVVGTRVVVRDMATRQEVVAQTGEDGRYTVEAPTPGTYLVSVAREGFSEAVRNRDRRARRSGAGRAAAPRGGIGGRRGGRHRLARRA